MFFFSTKLITLTHNLGRKQYSSTKLSCGVRKKNARQRLPISWRECKSQRLSLQKHLFHSFNKVIGFDIEKKIWVAPRSTLPFIFPRSINWVPETFRDLVGQSIFKVNWLKPVVALQPWDSWILSIKRDQKV